MADFDSIKSKIMGFVDKAVDKAKEIKDSEETKEFIEKTKETAVKVGNKAKDVAIDVGVKAMDVAEDLTNRGQKVMHDVKEKNEAKKDTCVDSEIVSEEDVEECDCEPECNCTPACDCEAAEENSVYEESEPVCQTEEKVGERPSSSTETEGVEPIAVNCEPVHCED